MINLASPHIGEEEVEAVSRVLRSGGLAQGPEAAAFETEFATFIGGGKAVAVNSGTSALHLALLALGIGLGDEVLVPSFTFAASANSICLAGATPIFVDIDPQTFCIDPNRIQSSITSRTRAIMPVHLYGHPADMTSIQLIAKEHNLLMIEDAAQAHGARWDGQPVGLLGDAACFSFYPTKNMTSGEGGMILFQDTSYERMARLLRNQGMERRYDNEVVGFNLRMTDIHAAIGRVQLRRLPNWNVARAQNAAQLTERIKGPMTPVVLPNATHVFHQFTVKVPENIRDPFVELVQQRGVGCGVYYPTPVHRLSSFGLCDRCRIENGGRCDKLSVTDQIASECVSLPVHPGLSEQDINTITEVVNTTYKELVK